MFNISVAVTIQTRFLSALSNSAHFGGATESMSAKTN